jgi:hypothetical protein
MTSAQLLHWFMAIRIVLKVFLATKLRLNLMQSFGTAALAKACTPEAAGSCKYNNGRVDGNWNDNTIASEAFVFWQHVRLANLATGATKIDDTNYLPKNADGGLLGVESGGRQYWKCQTIH